MAPAGLPDEIAEAPGQTPYVGERSALLAEGSLEPADVLESQAADTGATSSTNLLSLSTYCLQFLDRLPADSLTCALMAWEPCVSLPGLTSIRALPLCWRALTPEFQSVMGQRSMTRRDWHGGAAAPLRISGVKLS